ncbi:ABC transporter permease [Sphingosinicella rhizophila]|uniref:ABC transporter permease n=1 Tax=Sphingosinicella rhizophila TaxID=3050082 RepID=A0ABU3QBC1_9SPHN|nr:ABC transporter permease [Sphingosinicella sp. GR2756]MDT9600705.1 ABC transporter permease [Sphingosinicella sp. GR2756]
MPASLFSEMLKLRNSLALLLCAAAPLMVVVLTSLVVMDRDEPTPWPLFTTNLAAAWGLFMLPMTVTALTILLAQIEHGPRFWNHLLALPVPKWRLFAAKSVLTILLVGLMSAALILLTPVAGHFAEWAAAGPQLVGTPRFKEHGAQVAGMFLSSLLLIAVQLWAALRFRSFVPPLVLGIGGTLVAVVASGAEQGVWFPWLIPANMLSENPAQAALAGTIGFWGGLAALAAMIVDLSRREFR